jgi:calcium permeable stress-gated cation channel
MELRHFKATREEYLSRPNIACQIEQRTILLTAMPKDYTEDKIKNVFPGVDTVWINHKHKKLDKMVEEREKLSLKLEGAETKLIKKVNKAAKVRKDVPEGKTISSVYLPDKKRPHHRLGYPVINWFFGKKVFFFSDGSDVGRYDQLL